MEKNRLEAFTDGVLAIVITIMVLELKRPEGDSLRDLLNILPMALGYMLSFMFIAVYWINHHLMFQNFGKVNVKVLWANLGWLFMMSFIPLTTEWIGAYPLSWVPTSLYFTNMLLASLTFHLVYYRLLSANGQKSTFKWEARNVICVVTYFLSAVLGGLCPIAAYLVVAAVTIWWAIARRKVSSQK